MVGSWELRELWSSLSELSRFLPAGPVRVHSAPALASSRSLHTRCRSEAWVEAIGRLIMQPWQEASLGNAEENVRDTRVFPSRSRCHCTCFGRKVKQMWCRGLCDGPSEESLCVVALTNFTVSCCLQHTNDQGSQQCWKQLPRWSCEVSPSRAECCVGGWKRKADPILIPFG